MTTLADRLRDAMRAANMTQTELANACGVRQPSVAGWLSEKSKFLRGKNLLAAARALNVSEDWLATGKGPRARTAVLERPWPFPFPPEDWELVPASSRRPVIAAALAVVEEARKSAPDTRRPSPSKGDDGHG